MNNIKQGTEPTEKETKEHNHSFAKPHDNVNLEQTAVKHSDKFINRDLCVNVQVSDLKYSAAELESVSNFAEVMFKCKRKNIFANDKKLSLKEPQLVIVEVENGLDVGTVVSSGKKADDKYRTCYKKHNPKFKIVRLMTKDDHDRFLRNQNEEPRVVEKARELVIKHSLDMKVTEAEWQFDRQRLTIYFTAPQRIDFRELVKDLARIFKTRIELRQISTREEAKRIGGIGPCGRKLCCTSFSNEFSHITLDHARTQQLSNNVAKLSGFCGRLKCCLLYEYDTYVDAFKKYPPLDCMIELSDGLSRIVKVDIFKDEISLHNDKNGKYATITYHELEELAKNDKIIPPNNSGGHAIKKCFFDDDDDYESLKQLEDEF